MCLEEEAGLLADEGLELGFEYEGLAAGFLEGVVLGLAEGLVLGFVAGLAAGF